MPTSERMSLGSSEEALPARKDSHLEICATGPVEATGKTTLFEEVDFLHAALPELDLDAIDTTVSFLGKVLRAPLVITGMTGGTPDAFAVNRDLARVAERCGVAIGLGSQRIMQRDPSTAWTFAVREFAPTTVLLANLGLIQAAALPTREIRRLVEGVGADGLCIHLNPAQERIQAGGDRDFRGGYETFRRLVGELGVPVIAKETGCGLSRATVECLRECGVRHFDVAGAGGTSWVKVETLRGEGRAQRLGELLADWGIPTAASLAGLRGLDLEVIASGGVRHGLDVAKAIALGARLAGMALPVFRAWRAGGVEAAVEAIEETVEALRSVMLLTGSGDLAALGRQPLVFGPRLRAWLAAGERAGGDLA